MNWRSAIVAIAALSISLRGELLPIRAYTASDGLAADHVNRIVADSRGFVWFCTPEGLSRFDGYRFVNFAASEGLPHRVVEDLLETGSGQYLVGTARGLCQLLPSSGKKLSAYLPGGSRSENYITTLCRARSGRIWCGTADGLFELLNSFKFRKLPLQPIWDRVTITDILEGPQGGLWVGTPSGMYVIGNNGAIQHLDKADGLPSEWVNVLLRDSSGRIWAGTRGGLALMREGGPGGRCGLERIYADNEGLPNVAALAEGRDGSIWIGTTNGLSRMLPGSGDTAFRHYTRANGLIDRQVAALDADTAGNIWVATEGAGVMRIQPGGFTTFREQDGLASDRVWAVLADRHGAVLAVTARDRGQHLINVFDGARFHITRPKLLRTWGTHQILLESRTGDWWAATNSGLCRYAAREASDLGGEHPRACYAEELQVYKVFEDSSGGIWASAQSSKGDRLIRWDPVEKNIKWFADGPSQSPLLVNAFAEDHDGNVWMGVIARGDLYRYDGRRFIRYSQREGVPAGTITSLAVGRDGRLWIGSTDGLGLVENPGGRRIRVRTFDTTTGLASNSIESIVEDNAGRIYAGTEKGVDRLNPKTGQVRHFSAADGLARGRITSALRDSAGNLWFSTTQGISRLRPATDDAVTTPTVLITDLQIGRERYPISQAGASLVACGHLPPSQNQFRVEFAGFNNEPEENLRYTYKMEHGDSNWRPPGRDHEANYPGLTPGTYRFLVKAVNSEGRESVTAARIDFVVLPPLWRRWWFEGLALAALGGLILAAHRFRVAQAVTFERMRTAIATDLHDDIGASLSQIAILTEVARMDETREHSERSERLERVATLAREVSDSMSDIVWSIRAEPEGVSSLIRRMREFAIDLLESQAITFELRVPEKDVHLHLSMQARRHLFLLFKECIHNAARHSGGTAVVAELAVVDQQVLLRVTDNGRGDTRKPRSSGGSGIPNMRYRAESLGGRLEWTASPGQGCTVVARLPIRRKTFGKPGL